MRSQLLAANVGWLDGVVFTHAHADHIHGIDDLRMIVFNRGARLPAWADPDTSESLINRFAYAFVQPAGSLYSPILDLHRIDDGDFAIAGDAGRIALRPLRVRHGPIDALGFRIAGIAYLPDVSEIPAQVWSDLGSLDCWIVDALRRKPHPTHAHLERSLEWIARARPRRAILTNMHNDLDFATVEAETPEHVSPAHDGMVLEFPA